MPDVLVVVVSRLSGRGRHGAASLADRQYIEEENAKRLSEVQMFTFEPHVCEIGGGWGFKHENIYCVDADGHVVEI